MVSVPSFKPMSAYLFFMLGRLGLRSKRTIRPAELFYCLALELIMATVAAPMARTTSSVEGLSRSNFLLTPKMTRDTVGVGGQGSAWPRS